MNARSCFWSAKALALLGVSALALACGPPASAQYPGGYPGSGPSPGWSAIDPNGNLGSPGLVDVSTFYNFDWTRLYLARNTVTNGISSDDYSGPYQFSSAGSISVGGSPSGCTEATVLINGTSTVKWKWTPPNNPLTGQPDWVNFPAPPLFVLGRITAASTAYNGAGGSTTPKGVTAYGDVTDGWGWNPSFNSIPGSAPADDAENPRRHVLAAVASGSNFQVTMSPTAYLEASASTNTGGGSGGYGYGYGSSGSMDGFTGLSEAAMPIMLSSPNPLTNPQLGDGSNQFVYSGDTPDGYLYVPGAINVAGASSADAQWLVDNKLVDMAILNSVIPNTFTHQWAVNGSTININTPNNNYPNYQPNTWIFKGLPDGNDGFGNHDANLYVQGNLAQTAHIQTFYNATAHNYPRAEMDFWVDNYYTPNWFYYFEQAYPNTTTYDPQLIDFVGNPTPNAVGMAQCQGYWDESVSPNRKVVENSMTKMNAGALTIGGDPADTQPGRGIPVFEINSTTNYLDYLGQMYVKGIYSYLYINAHEKKHNDLQISNDCIAPTYDGSTPPDAPADTDGDWMTDAAEAKYHLDYKRRDTTGYYSDRNFFPEGRQYTNADTEAICDIAGLNAVLSNPNAWQKDWSDAGVQYGARGAYFPYEYVPAYGASPSNLPPDSTVVSAYPLLLLKDLPK